MISRLLARILRPTKHVLTTDGVFLLGFSTELVIIAEELGAYELYEITSAQVVAVTNEGAISTAVPQRDTITDNQYGAVVVSIVAAFVMLAALAYCCCGGEWCGAAARNRRDHQTEKEDDTEQPAKKQQEV